jgi:hypothetical protein
LDCMGKRERERERTTLRDAGRSHSIPLGDL